MQEILSIWWVWMAAALALGILEVLAPGFIFLGFAIGAALVSLIVAFSLMTISWQVMLVLWAGLSLAVWLVMRRAFSLPKGNVKHFDHDIND